MVSLEGAFPVLAHKNLNISYAEKNITKKCYIYMCEYVYMCVLKDFLFYYKIYSKKISDNIILYKTGEA